MSSYFSSFASSSSISNALGSRLNSLRRAITLGDEADDPDNEDCSHISNALRAYYTEKGRAFPQWLPPDPKAPVAAPSRVIATTQLPGGGANGQAPAAAAYGRGGGLGDLWGDGGAAQPPPQQTASLRRARGAATAPPLTSMHSAPPGPVSSPTPPLSHAHSHSPGPSGGLHPAGARPLPSQRAGSQQSARPTPDRAGSAAGSAQERLRARLQGGRSPSPSLDPSVRKPVGSTGRNW